ncbi:MAG: immunity 17 family protein [Muribaculaceae bacterium]|nr:immunity 17 family protein [Muribaculaceae bacterium]
MSLTIGTIITAVILAIVGLLSILASIANWDWFFNSSSTRLYTNRLSRRVSRIIYSVLGILILFMATYLIVNLKE